MLKQFFKPIRQDLIAKLHDLEYFFLEVTNKCNINCLHCGSDCQKDSTTPDLPQAKIKSILEEIKAHYNSKKIHVVITGGEPLLYKDVFDLGKMIYDLEFSWGMVSNGFGWNKSDIKKAMLSGLHSITISLDGMEQQHNWLRKHEQSFKRAISTIKLLSANRFWKKFDVITCINRKNINSLDEIYNLIKSLKVPMWRIFIIEPFGRAVEEPDLFLMGEEFRYLLDKIKEYRKLNEITVEFTDSGYLGPHYDDQVRGYDYFCRAGINVAGIMANGDILACPNIDRKFAQGNIFKHSFIDIWDKKFQNFRNKKWMKRGECDSCGEWRQCRGNSFHLRNFETKETKLCHVNYFDLPKRRNR